MMRRLTLIFILLGVCSLALAQDAPTDEPTALMRALATVPDTPAVRESGILVSYADWQAAFAGRPGVMIPESYAEWQTALDADDVAAAVVPWTLPPAGPDRLIQYFRLAIDYNELVGFDFFDIEQGLTFGQPPSQGVVLFGGFDPAAVVAAHEARGFTVEQADDSGTLVCGPDGCEEGLKMNLQGRDPANPFGGEFGRNEPLFVTETALLNSPDYEMLQDTISAYQGETPSLADSSEVQAAASVLSAYPHVAAAVFVDPFTLGAGDPAALLGTSASPEQIQAALEALVEDTSANPIPLYEMLVLAAAADESAEYGLALLVYSDADAAAQAAASIDGRLSEMESLRIRAPYAEVLSAAGTVEPAEVVTDDATGKSVVVVSVTRPPTPIEPDQNDRLVQAYLGFYRLQQMLIARDLLWLAWGGPEE